MAKKLTRITRRLSDAEREQHARIREAVMKEFPPKVVARQLAAPGLGAALQAARRAQEMTWYEVAQRAGLPNRATVRDMELGRNVKLSELQAVAQALGLKLELVPAGV